MEPFVKEYTNDEQLQYDVQKLNEKGVKKEDIYVLSHDDDRTKRFANTANANTIGLHEMNLESAVGNLFNKKGDELRNKLQEIGFSEAENYGEDLDEGKILLMVINPNNVEGILS